MDLTPTQSTSILLTAVSSMQNTAYTTTTSRPSIINVATPPQNFDIIVIGTHIIHIIAINLYQHHKHRQLLVLVRPGEGHQLR